MKNLSKLKATAAPAALGLAMLAMPALAQEAPQSAAASTSAPAEIVVTGSRLSSPNLESPSPVTVLSAAELKTTGTTRVEDLVNSLPQVFAGQGSNISNGSTGTATLDLRGLGPNRTLVLINGRRVVPGDPSSSAADINIIPGSMIKRIDVLTGGASSVYGADAVAGVVNFVMDTNFEGFRLDSQYSVYNHNNDAGIDTTDALDRRGFGYPRGGNTNGGTIDVNAAFGAGFDDGHGHVTAYAGYRKADPVLQSTRDYSACQLQARTAVQFAADKRKYQCGGSATSANGTFFTSDNTYQLGAGNTFVPGSTPYNFAPLNYFQRPDERYTAGLFADYEISSAIHPYMEFMFMDDRTVAQIAPSGDFGNTVSINCDNPLLSAQQKSIVCANSNLLVSSDPARAFDTVGSSGEGATAFNFIDPTTGLTYNKGLFQPLRRNVEGGPRRDDRQHTSYRAVFGSKGELGKAFSYDAFYQYGRTILAETYTNDFSISRLGKALDVVTNPTTGQAVCRAALSGEDPNCTPWNIFGGGVSPASLAYLQAPGFQRGINTEQVANVAFTGRLGEYGIKAPWATDGVGIVVGGEYRKETLDFKVDNEFSTGDLAGQGGATNAVSGDFNVKEFFSEVQIPLVQDSFFKELSINGGYRYSKYSVGNAGSFTTDTYKIEGVFAPIRDILFRGGYNRAVRAPTLQNLFAPQSVALDGSTDPCAGITITAADTGCLLQGLHVGQVVAPNPASQYNGLQGGNTSLRPETADTYTVGVVLTPSFLPGFNFSVDYFNIKVKGAIQGIGADQILSLCTNNADPFFCGLVHRDGSGSLWRTPDGYVVDTDQNIGGASTKGIDVTANYTHSFSGFGRVTASFVGTYLKNLITDDGVSGEPVDCAGKYGTICGTPSPKWRHQMRLGVDFKDGIGISGRWRYVGKAALDTPSTRPALVDPIKAFNYFDLTMSARVGDHYSFRLGANNVFDKTPPTIASQVCAPVVCNGNAFPQVYDGLGRYIYAGVTLDF